MIPTYDTKRLASGATAYRWTCSCGARSSVWLTDQRSIDTSWRAHERMAHQPMRVGA